MGEGGQGAGAAAGRSEPQHPQQLQHLSLHHPLRVAAAPRCWSSCGSTCRGDGAAAGRSSAEVMELLRVDPQRCCSSCTSRGAGAGAATGRPAEVLLQVASPASLMQVASRLHQCVNLPRSHEKGALVKLATGSLLTFYYWALIYKNYI